MHHDKWRGKNALSGICGDARCAPCGTEIPQERTRARDTYHKMSPFSAVTPPNWSREASFHRRALSLQKMECNALRKISLCFLLISPYLLRRCRPGAGPGSGLKKPSFLIGAGCICDSRFFRLVSLVDVWEAFLRIGYTILTSNIFAGMMHCVSGKFEHFPDSVDEP